MEQRGWRVQTLWAASPRHRPLASLASEAVRCAMSRTLLILVLGSLLGCGAATLPSSERSAVVGDARTFECVAEDPGAGVELDREALGACLGDPAALEAAAFVLGAAESEHDVEAYLAHFRSDALRTFARWEPESPHDLVLDRARFERVLHASAEAGGSASDDPITVTFARITMDVASDRALVRVLTTYRSGGGEDVTLEGQEYRLERTDERWQIVVLRTWLRGWGATDEGEDFSDATWPERDRAVEVARARAAAAGPERLAETSRALRDALANARRSREALEVARTVTSGPEAGPADWRRAAGTARAALRLDEATDALARGPSAPLPSLDEVVRDELECAPIQVQEVAAVEDPEVEDEEGQDACHWEQMALLAASDPSSRVRSVAIVRVLRGEQAAQSHHLVIGLDGDWHAGPQIADGPFVGNQVVGVLSFSLSDPTLRQIVPGGDEELVAHYRTEENEDDVETEESGLLVCGALGDVPRCARVPLLLRTSTGGEAPRTATASVTFDDDGSVRMTRRSGRSPRLTTGTRPFDQLFLNDEPDDGP